MKPQKKRETFTFRIGQKSRDRLDQMATQKGISASRLVRLLVEDRLERYETFGE